MTTNLRISPLRTSVLRRPLHITFALSDNGGDSPKNPATDPPTAPATDPPPTAPATDPPPTPPTTVVPPTPPATASPTAPATATPTMWDLFWVRLVEKFFGKPTAPPTAPATVSPPTVSAAPPTALNPDHFLFGLKAGFFGKQATFRSFLGFIAGRTPYVFLFGGMGLVLSTLIVEATKHLYNYLCEAKKIPVFLRPVKTSAEKAAEASLTKAVSASLACAESAKASAEAAKAASESAASALKVADQLSAFLAGERHTWGRWWC